nr:hypothetical protein [Tanacetum cinerariifolium]
MSSIHDDSSSSNISVTTIISENSSNPINVSSATVNDRPRIWIPAIESSLKSSKRHVCVSLNQAYGKLGGFVIKLCTGKNYHGTEVPDIKYFNCTKRGKVKVKLLVMDLVGMVRLLMFLIDGFSGKVKNVDVSGVSKPNVKRPFRKNTSCKTACLAWMMVRKINSGMFEFSSSVCNKRYFKEQFCRIVWNERISIDMFEHEWASIMDEFDLGSHKWLCYLYDMRHRWISAFLHDKDTSGLMRTTLRSKSENRYSNRFTNLDLTLVKFISHFESAMDIQRYTQKKNDHESRYNRPEFRTDWKLEKDAAELFTFNIFYEVQDEIVASIAKCLLVLYYSSDTILTCSYKRYELYGLLCHHILYVLRMNNEFPKEYVLDRWFKSDENVWVDTCADALDLYQLELSDLLAKAKSNVPVLMRVNKKDTFCSMLGITEPERVVIKVPRHSKNKGTGSHTRWKNMDELIQNEAESSKKTRTCFIFGKAKGHNCITFPHKDEINAANKRTKRVTRSSFVNYKE